MGLRYLCLTTRPNIEVGVPIAVEYLCISIEHSSACVLLHPICGGFTIKINVGCTNLYSIRPHFTFILDHFLVRLIIRTWILVSRLIVCSFSLLIITKYIMMSATTICILLLVRGVSCVLSDCSTWAILIGLVVLTQYVVMLRQIMINFKVWSALIRNWPEYPVRCQLLNACWINEIWLLIFNLLLQSKFLIIGALQHLKIVVC